jgi:hypothetical protein
MIRREVHGPKLARLTQCAGWFAGAIKPGQLLAGRGRPGLVREQTLARDRIPILASPGNTLFTCSAIGTASPDVASRF